MNEDYLNVPPPHLLKRFSEQAREESNKRKRPGYCKTFAKLCIDWALASQLTPNDCQIRSLGTTPPPELVEQWRNEWIYNAPGDNDELCFLASRGAQWGADQELEACCQWVGAIDGKYGPRLRLARRPKPPSLKQQALEDLHVLATAALDAGLGIDPDRIRRALEALPE